MLFLILWLIAFLSCSLYAKRDRNIYLITIVFFTILFAFTYDNADFNNYFIEYSNSAQINWQDTEPIWMLLMHICNLLRLPFQVFRVAIFLIGIALMQKTITLITTQRNTFLVLYFIYPFIIDATQIRNFFAMCILVYGLHFLMSDKKRDILKYVVAVLVASLVHNIFIIYLLFIAVKLIDFKKAIVLAIFVFAGMLVAFNTIPLLVLRYFGNYHNGLAHVAKYVIKDTVSPTMIMALLVFYVGAVLGAIWVNKEYKEIEAVGLCDSQQSEGVSVVSKCIVLISLSFLLNIYSMDFARVMRNIIVVEYAAILSVIEINKRGNNHLRLIVLSIVALYAGWLFVYYPYSENVFYPFFKNNYFFEVLKFR